jgi:hypothetical protein
MKVVVTIDDTTAEIEDDEPYTHEHALAMLDTCTAGAVTAYQVALSAGEISTKGL